MPTGPLWKLYGPPAKIGDLGKNIAPLHGEPGNSLPILVEQPKLLSFDHPADPDFLLFQWGTANLIKSFETKTKGVNQRNDICGFNVHSELAYI